MIEYAFILLAFASMLLNVFQHIYWSGQVQKLIDKLMSRNYADYSYTKAQAEALPLPSMSKLENNEPDSELETLNQVMTGLI